MNLPAKENIKFAQESAKRINSIQIEAEPKFYFDTDSKSSNSINEDFLTYLESGKHLNDDFLSVK